MKYGIIEISGGIGKNIMATAVIKNIKKTYPDLNILVVTAYPEIFLHNTDVYRVFKFGSCPYFYNDYVKNKETIFFCDEPYRSSNYLLENKHLILSWCEAIKVPFSIPQMEVVINPKELQFVSNKIRANKPLLVFQPFGGASELPYSWNRDIPPQQAQTIVDILKDKYHIIQLYHKNQPKLNDCEHANWPLRDLFALIQLSSKVLGIDSFAQHFCAAINKPATVCWVTNKPKVFGYNIHRNILPKPEVYIESSNRSIDGYFQEYDFTGSRNYDYPFNTTDIFNVTEIVETIL